MNLPRDDISDFLIHFTKPANTPTDDPEHDAAKAFVSIVKGKIIKAGTGMIKGGYSCICFTESPVSKLPHMFAQREHYEIRYHPFGVMFPKRLLYKAGARPVIYGPDSDFEVLPEAMRYRHVRYEPNKATPIDHTWEREWRLHQPTIEFSPDSVTLIVPKRSMADTIRKKDANWHCIVLEDLG